MDSLDNSIRKRHVRTKDVLLFCFVCWPFFWSIWKFLRLPVMILGSGFPVIFMVLLAVMAVICEPIRVKKNMLPWLLFYLVTILEIRNANLRTYALDIGMSICAWLICASAGHDGSYGDRAVKCIRALGLFTALTVVLNSVFHLTTGVLSPLFTSESAEMFESNGYAGGFFPYAGYAGCFIVPGLAALYFQYEDRRKDLRFLISMLIFLFSVVLMRKRGFILDIVLAGMFMLYLRLRSRGELVLSKQKSVKHMLAGLCFLLLILAMYLFVPVVRSSVDSFAARFFAEDKDFSGRGRLYARALSYFKTRPWTGIGWGRFREVSIGVFYHGTSTKTYEVHNVYIQLLCENGVIGLTAFLFAVGTMLISSCRKYLRLVGSADTERERVVAIKCSVFIQLFFLTYCLSGNPLYDYNFSVTYFLGVLLSFV